MTNEKRLPDDIGFDPKHNRLHILVEGYGWVTIPFEESMFRALWAKYFEAKKILKGEEVLEDFILED